MTPKYVLTRYAQQDLADIGETIADESGLVAAERVVDEIRRAFRLLADSPDVGHGREDITADPSVRFWTVHSYLIAFVPTVTPLPIVSILHGARDPRSIAQRIEDSRSQEE